MTKQARLFIVSVQWTKRKMNLALTAGAILQGLAPQQMLLEFRFPPCLLVHGTHALCPPEFKC